MILCITSGIVVFLRSKVQSVFGTLILISCLAMPNVADAQGFADTPVSSRRIAQAPIEENQAAEGSNQQGKTPVDAAKNRDLVTMELIDDEIAKVEKAELEESAKSAILNHYVDARQQLALATNDQAAAVDFRQQVQNAIQNRDNLRKTLNEVESTTTDEVPIPETLAELEQLRLNLENSVELLQEELKLASEEPDRRSKRKLEFPQLEIDAQTRLAEVRKQLATAAPATDDPLLTRSRMVALQAEKQRLEQSLELLKVERDAYEATAGSLPLRQELATKRLQIANTKLTAVVEAIGQLRAEEIATLMKRTRDAMADAPDSLKDTAQYNVDLAQTLADETKQLKQVKALRRDGQDAVQKVESELSTMRSRVEAIGLNYEVGTMLRRDKTELVNRESPFQKTEVASDLQSAQVKKFQWQDERTALSSQIGDLEQENESLKQELENRSGIDKEQRDSLQDQLDLKNYELDLLKKRRQILGKLEDTEGELFSEMFDLKSLQAQYSKKRREYLDFLDERILWVRSEPVLGYGDIDGIRSAVSWLTSASNWQSVADALTRGVESNLPSVLMIAVGLLALVVLQPRSRREIKRLGAIAAKRSCRDFAPTLSAFFYTAVLSFLWPAIGLSLGWLIDSQYVGVFEWSVGRALTLTSLIALPFELMRCVCRNEGLAQNHFSWTEGFRNAVRKHMGWFMAAGLSLFILIVIIAASNNNEFNRLGRLAMLVLLVVCIAFTTRIFSVFRPGGTAYKDSASGFDATVSRIRSLLFLAIIVGLALLFLFAVMGYYESVCKIVGSVLKTVIVLILTVIAFGMAMRFFLVRRRKLRFEQLVQQRKAAIAAAEKQAESGVNIASEALDIDLQNESGMDIIDVSRQARELTSVIFLIVVSLILLGIWQYLLPATKILDSWELWRITVGSGVEFVTARDLLLSLIAFAITFFSVRNIPGMLELLLLQRLPLDAGARYAVASIFRYILLVVGVIVALGYLKIPWSNYSWLVAAISVGLGFGLQEIVANFVSGLILLLERPVRVGDVVTIDGVTGIVSRIQMRATTITNWDNQELVVPNKDLISGKLLNWTLSNIINRIALKVGVAYGTDISKVREIITKIVERHPDVLKEPAPIITFEEFGDSSLNFVIRCCTTSIKRRWNLIDEINSAVNEAFEREGIEIPFPQRVVHMVEESGPEPEMESGSDSN